MKKEQRLLWWLLIRPAEVFTVRPEVSKGSRRLPSIPQDGRNSYLSPNGNVKFLRFGSISPVFAWMVALVFAASTPVQAQSGKDGASAYALQLPVDMPQPAAGGLHRMALPAQALVKLQTTGLADLRVFDAQGLALPMALAAAPSSRTKQQTASLVAYPIMGGADASSGQGLSLRIEDVGGKRVVQLDGAGQQLAGSAGAAGAQKVVGALLDARTIPGLTSTSAVALDLQADIPNAQPIRFVLQASKNLQNWQTLADAVLYRVDGSPVAASNRLSFGAFNLKDHYLRITWSDTAGTNAPTTVTVRGATVITGEASVSAPRVAARIATTLTSPHEISFALPFATPLVALDIAPQGNNELSPVRVLGRNDRSQPWRVLASGVAYNLSGAGATQRSSPLELGRDTSVREIKIEADTKTPGFSAPPQISLLFEPTQIVFLASGNAPYTLAAGQPQAASAYLPLQSLIPGYESGAENKLPLALARVADAGGDATPLVAAPPTSQSLSTRNLVLWGVLVAGALALGWMAWVLMRQTRKPPT